MILASSDSFFHIWITKLIGSTRYEAYVIGDLEKEDARVFWQQKLKRFELELANENMLVPQWPDFDTVYSICGGNMFLLGKAMKYWAIECSTPPVDWYEFPYVDQEILKLTKASLPSDDLASYEYGKSGPVWNSEDLNYVMTELINSPLGAVSYQMLCREKGRSVIESLIEHNVLHLRPINRGSYDIQKSGIKGAVVTAESACGLYAMNFMVNPEVKVH